MKKWLLALLLLPTNVWSDTITTGALGLLKPTTGQVSSRPAGDKLNSNFDIIDSSFTSLKSQVNNIAQATAALALGGGGASSLAVGTGTLQSVTIISSPTSIISFANGPFKVNLVNNATAYIDIDYSSITAQGLVTGGSSGIPLPNGDTSYIQREATWTVTGSPTFASSTTFLGDAIFDKHVGISSNVRIYNNFESNTDYAPMLYIKEGRVNQQYSLLELNSVTTGRNGYYIKAGDFFLLNSVQSPTFSPSPGMVIGSTNPTSMIDVVGGSITVRGNNAGLYMAGVSSISASGIEVRQSSITFQNYTAVFATGGASVGDRLIATQVNGSNVIIGFGKAVSASGSGITTDQANALISSTWTAFTNFTSTTQAVGTSTSNIQAFYAGFTSTSDARGNTFVNFRSTTDTTFNHINSTITAIKTSTTNIQNFYAGFTSTSDARGNTFVNFRSTTDSQITTFQNFRSTTDALTSVIRFSTYSGVYALNFDMASLHALSTGFATIESTASYASPYGLSLVPMLVRAFDGTLTETVHGKFILPEDVDVSSNVLFMTTVIPKTAGPNKNVTILFNSTATFANGAGVYNYANSTGAQTCLLIGSTGTFNTCSWTQSMSALNWQAYEQVFFEIGRGNDTAILGTTNLSGDLYMMNLMIQIPMVYKKEP